jgi:prolyl-tRNA synthetase
MQEMLMPALSPYELWEESGRSAYFGQDALPAMIVEARGGRFVLGPTHEEVATHTVGAEVDSYRQLPVTIYQIQTKFRDEARPRFGLMRTRELVMCDAYSFDADKATMGVSYQAAVDAYLAIFKKLSLDRWWPSPGPSEGMSTMSSWCPRWWGRTTSPGVARAGTPPMWRPP